jgi:murein L,D-transpeptidase YcbB/YkuD
VQIRILIVIFLVIFISGCATTRNEQDRQVQQFQNRINYLEAELDDKNQEISSLEEKLEKQRDKQPSKEITVKQMSIKQIQTALKNAGFYKGSIDGKMGSQTKEAIKTFQKANDLKPDGIVGKRTADKLTKYLP